jgi:predicted HD superfamily hydrolase involved in NAD metabolism
MHRLLVQLIDGIQLTGDMRTDMQTFLIYHGCPKTAGHCGWVAAEAKRLAARFGVDESQAEIAGWLHDISAVFSHGQRPQIARQLGVEVLPEEDEVPMIIHQKLSVVVARDIFGVMDEAVLSAIGCHTTLKAKASVLDKVVFVADKIQWDQSGNPPYLAGLLSALEQSLDQAALYFLEYLWQRRDTLPVVHPWFVEAYRQLSDFH